MDDGNHRRVGVRFEKPLRVERRSPLGGDRNHLGTASDCYVAHASTEDAVHADYHDVTWRQHVHERRLHPGGAGSRDGEREGVLGAEHRAQPFTGLVEQCYELGVEMTEQRPREGLDHLRIGIARAGAHQDPVAKGHSPPFWPIFL